MRGELLPCWRCGAPARHAFQFNSGYSVNVWHCSAECGAVTLTANEWQANAAHANELRIRAERAEAEAGRLRETLIRISHQRRCELCDSMEMASEALEAAK